MIDTPRLTQALNALANADDGTAAWAALHLLPKEEKELIDAIEGLIDSRIELYRRCHEGETPWR